MQLTSVFASFSTANICSISMLVPWGAQQNKNENIYIYNFNICIYIHTIYIGGCLCVGMAERILSVSRLLCVEVCNSLFQYSHADVGARAGCGHAQFGLAALVQLLNSPENL